MTKTPPKAPAAPAAAKTPAPEPTTEAKNAGQSPDAGTSPTGEGAAPQPPADGAAQSKDKDAPPAEVTSVTLAAPYGYIDEDEQHRFWHAGTVVTDADQIADLMARKAPLEGIDHGNKE